MKTFRTFALLFIIFCFAFNSINAQKPAVDLKAEEQAIRSLSMKWLELAKSRDVINMTALFIKDGVIYRENQEPAIGTAAIQDQFTKDFRDNPKYVPNWTTDRVDISSSADLAVEYGSYNETGRGLDGTGIDHGRFVTVYHKINGTWKVSSDCSISTKPEEPAK